MAEIWERQKNESSKAYAAFCIYRDLGTDGSIDHEATTSIGGGSSLERADKELKNAKTQEKGLLELMARKEELLEELAEIDKQINELQAKRPINN